MSKSGKRLLKAAREMRQIARGEASPAHVHFPQSEQARILAVWAELEKEQAERDEYEPRKRSICDYWARSAGRR
jgi:hypothetical protein